MKINLPSQIQHFIDASNTGDPTKVLKDFTEESTVVDENKTLKGLKAIQDWMIQSKLKYNHTSKPLEIKQDKDEMIMRAEITGNFTGSPVTLSYYFKIVDDHIASLKIE